MDPDRAPTRRLSSEEAKVIKERIRDFYLPQVLPSVAAIVSDAGSHAFSGTFVHANGRFFVLTARHCLEQISDWHSVEIHASTSSRPVTSAETVGRFWATSPKDRDGDDPCYRLDIGCILLHRSAAAALRPKWIDVARLTSARIGPGDLTLLVGFPAVLATRESTDRETSILGLRPLRYWGEVVNRDPGLLRLESERHIDLFIEFDPNDLVNDATDEPVPPIEPHGMSGCAVFAINRTRRGELWHPGSLDVVGIQSTFIRNKGLLRATRAEYGWRALAELLPTMLRAHPGDRSPNEPEITIHCQLRLRVGGPPQEQCWPVPH